jgi:hypothetical protein
MRPRPIWIAILQLDAKRGDLGEVVDRASGSDAGEHIGEPSLRFRSPVAVS